MFFTSIARIIMQTQINCNSLKHGYALVSCTSTGYGYLWGMYQAGTIFIFFFRKMGTWLGYDFDAADMTWYQLGHFSPKMAYYF